MSFVLQTSWFFIVLFALFTVPGWLFLRAFFDTHRFTLLEWSLLSVATSLTSLNFLMLILFYIFRIPLTALSLTIALAIEIGLWIFIAYRRRSPDHGFAPSHFSSREYLLIGAIFILTLGIKTLFLTNNIAPSATDLGHHTYWSSVIAHTGTIPTYTKRDIDTLSDGHYQLGQPKPIADFIIGEHLPFTAINLLTGLDFFSAFPVIFLFFINLCSDLALFVLAWRFFFSHLAIPRAKTVAIFTLLLIGPLYAISSPETKFVSGGVVGNVIGNFFIPILWLTYYRALKEKDSSLLTLGFFLTFGLAYIHHLSTLMFLFGLVFALIFILLSHLKCIRATLREWINLAFKPAPLLFIVIAILFFFFVIAPSYADPKAIGTAIGTPTKGTRVGLPFLEFTNGTIGIPRIAFGIIGLGLAAFLFRHRRIIAAVIAGWSLSLLLLSLAPQWAFVNIPSNRVGTYAIFPLTLLAGYTLSRCLPFLTTRPSKSFTQTSLPIFVSTLILITWSTVFFGNGLFDNAQNISTANKQKNQSVVETFSAASFVASVITPTDLVLKDHNYLTADSWIKHFFLRDYNFPLSRGYFKRYNDVVKTREQCTLWMISTPNTSNGKQCYTDLDVNYIMVNPQYDQKQFEQTTDFSLVYRSNGVAVYYRHP